MHKILRALIISDLFLLGGFALVQPIFAIFMLQGVAGATITAVGVATAIQLLTKGLLQIFVAKWTDAEPGNRRELLTLFIGSLILCAVPFGLMYASTLWQVYWLLFAYGLGGALSFPGWMVIFLSYSRKEQAGYEWSIYNTTISFGMALAAVLGAYLADFYSFRLLFFIVGILSLVGAFFIVFIFKHEYTRWHLEGYSKKSAEKK